MQYYDNFILLGLIALIVFLLYREVFQPAVIFLFAVTILCLLGILTTGEVLSGFSNEQIAIIMLLLVVSSVIQKTRLIDYLFEKIFKKTGSYKVFLGEMSVSAAFGSAFMNNTPIVSMLLPYVSEWGKKKGFPPSKLLIPLSYATILGGTTTLIGSSTNLIVNGLAMDMGLPSFGIFDFAYVGIPLVITGILYMLLAGHKLLPKKKDVVASFLENSREYLVETVIPEGSPLTGKTVEEANLRNLRGLFLVEVVRKGRNIIPVAPSVILEMDDRLIFAGVTETILDLIKPGTGLSLPKFFTMFNQEKIDIVEAVISYNSQLIGKNIRESGFRARYDAAVLAVHRNGEKLSGKIGSIELRSGDLLLLMAGKDFWKFVTEIQDIYIINKVKEIHNLNLFKSLAITAGVFSAILLPALGLISLFKSLLILVAVFIATKTISFSEVKKSLDLNLLTLAAFSFALGTAMIKTGTAQMIAGVIINAFMPLGIIGILIGLYLITNLLTEFINNNAAASIMFPVAFTTAQSLNINPVPLIMLIAFAASSSFITPIGYITNLMVYGPGGYRFKDFIRVGLPLSFIYMLVTILSISITFKIF